MSLNDPQWGRGGGSNGSNDGGRDGERRPQRQDNDGPPDLDELWRDFNRRLNSMFGRRGGGGRSGGGGLGGLRPNGKGAGVGLTAVLAVVALIWLGSGFYIVPEGQVGVVTTFGKYSETTRPGFRWRLPWPVQTSELVDVLSLRRVEVGTRGRPERLKEALLLSDDENIVDIQFEVQYRIKDDGATDYLFNSRNPTAAVIQTAESAMREVVGRKTMDSVLYESRQQIAIEVRERMQQMLDRYGTGILVSTVAIQNAQPPEQVQAAFDDAVKAGQDRERQINEGQAYANDVVPKARGLASRLMQEAEGYRTRVVETAQGDASRFRQVLTEYQKAPLVTRDRMYIDTMQQVFSNTTKVLVDSRQSNQLLYLPFDKLMQQALQDSAAPRPAPAAGAESTAPVETRSRDTSLRSRDREAR
ncbi:MAG: FtsH protease activity modulator HflK [Burkholderiaceae bacterium]|jgi:membrane protease subunit HflK|nr:FtsH protease activity modulator HflK [Burkholderiaceae bacterium]